MLLGTAIAMALPGERGEHDSTPARTACRRCSTRSPPAANNNGSAFAGLSANTTWYNTALGLAMVFGRFLPMMSGARAGRFAGPPGSYAGVPRHPAHPSTAVHRTGRGVTVDSCCPHLPAALGARAPR